MVAIPRHIAFQVGYPLDVEARAAAPAMTLEMNLGGSSQANCTSWGKWRHGQMMISGVKMWDKHMGSCCFQSKLLVGRGAAQLTLIFFWFFVEPNLPVHGPWCMFRNMLRKTRWAVSATRVFQAATAWGPTDAPAPMADSCNPHLYLVYPHVSQCLFHRCHCFQ